ncbi:hypothetical protein Acsp02_07650 [Actinoplanes sp. NBRC 103695]|nr:hypothetical protein Acsp02_07650 [Actinoplanes sp. NBRC 103695]
MRQRDGGITAAVPAAAVSPAAGTRLEQADDVAAVVHDAALDLELIE